MFAAVRDYLVEFTDAFGQGWNRFWFTRRDPYGLGVIRLLTGLVAFYVIFTYGPDLDTFFGPDGLLSVKNVVELQTYDVEVKLWRFSYLDYVKSPREMMFVHAVGLAILACFAVGFYSRISSILALLVVLSYVQRGPQLTSTVEPILCFVMFYLCLGPSGASASFDSWLANRHAGTIESGTALAANRKTSAAANISTRLIQVHLCVLYIMMGLGKMVAVTWWHGTGVWWLVARPESQFFDFTGLSQHVYIVNAWSHAIVLFELTFPILVWNRLARPLMLFFGFIYVVLVGLATSMFAYAAMLFVANLAFISPDVMRAILSRERKSPLAAGSA